MADRFQGKDVLVTGGSTGIGFASAKAFAEEGARVFITGRRKTELDLAARMIGERAVAIQADSSSLLDLDRLFEQVGATAGKLDVVFANAGGGSIAPLSAVTEKHFDDTFGGNVKGAFFTVQKEKFPPSGSISLYAPVRHNRLKYRDNYSCIYHRLSRGSAPI